MNYSAVESSNLFERNCSTYTNYTRPCATLRLHVSENQIRTGTGRIVVNSVSPPLVTREIGVRFPAGEDFFYKVKTVLTCTCYVTTTNV